MFDCSIFAAMPSYPYQVSCESLQTEPVEEFYRAHGKLLEFNLPGGIPESWPKLLEALNIEGPDNERSAAA